MNSEKKVTKKVSVEEISKALKVQSQVRAGFRPVVKGPPGDDCPGCGLGGPGGGYTNS